MCMPVIITPLREPIIICQYTGVCDERDIEKVFQATVRYLEDTRYPMVYRLVDTGCMQTPDEQVRRLILKSQEKRPGTARDERVIPVFASARSRAVQIHRELWATSRIDIRVPALNTLDQALRFVRQEILNSGLNGRR